MKAFLINPRHCSITEVEYDDSMQAIYEYIDATLMDTVLLNEDRDVAYVDDEGLYHTAFFWKFRDFPNPIAGNGLVLGTNAAGESISPVSETMETLEASVTFISRETAISMAEAADNVGKQWAEKSDSNIFMSAADIIKDQEYSGGSD